MTNQELAAVVSENVEKILLDNEGDIAKSLAAGFEPEDYVDPISARLVVKSMRLTAQIAAQITIRLLEAFGCVELPPDAPPDLRLIDGGDDT